MIKVYYPNDDLIRTLDELSLTYTRCIMDGETDSLIIRVEDEYHKNILSLISEEIFLISIYDYYCISKNLSPEEFIDFVDYTIKSKDEMVEFRVGGFMSSKLMNKFKFSEKDHSELSTVYITPYDGVDTIKFKLSYVIPPYLIKNNINTGTYLKDTPEGFIIFKAIFMSILLKMG